MRLHDRHLVRRRLVVDIGGQQGVEVAAGLMGAHASSFVAQFQTGR